MKLSISGVILSLLMMLFIPGLSGQELKMKYGDVTVQDLQMTEYPYDKGASAVFLGDFGEIRFEFDQIESDFQVVYTRHTRIKIFNKNGYEYADHKVRLYEYGSLEEKMGTFKATTYNLVNGKIEKSKLSKKDLLSEEESQYWKSESFTMPDVQDYCIIEYEYSIRSNYFRNLPVWYFQQRVPVVWSELNIIIPEYFTYKPVMSGYEALVLNDVSFSIGRITYTTKSTTGGRNSERTQFNNQTIDFQTKSSRMVANRVPAFISEPMLTSYENYVSKVRFELESVQYPNSTIRYFTNSWGSINKQLLENSSFGTQLDGGLYLNDIAGSLTGGIANNEERMVAGFEIIRHLMKYNNFSGIYTTGTLRNAFNNESGSVADINLMLVVLLRKAGLQADPVILSTRSNGIINQLFPSSTPFNYVICRVKIGNKQFLLDATDPLLPVGMLPEKCLNGSGRLVTEGEGEWIDLNTGHIYDYSSKMDVVLADNGDITGTMKNHREGYAAYRLRKMVEQEKSQDDLVRRIESNNTGLEITDYSYSGIDSIAAPVEEHYVITISGHADVANDIIYLSPLFFEAVKSNPFKLEERKYPIDFAYPYNETFDLSLEIPEGYMVDELPKPQKLALPDKSAIFEYSVTVDGNRLLLTNSFSINKPMFVYSEYQSLKDFYNQIVAKHAEQVVLKKIQ